MKVLTTILMVLFVSFSSAEESSYPIVDTAQHSFYSDDEQISLPKPEQAFFGQDASYIINPPSYTDNKDGTISDNVTGLMWQQTMAPKMTYAQALKAAKQLSLAGHRDWRVPTIKELYSLIEFDGQVKGQKAITPFIDTTYFNQPIGDTDKGERQIDAQTWSSTQYVGRTMRNDETVFGVNFVDGRIKGYPKYKPRSGEENKMYFRFVRGNSAYGNNDFVDNKDGTVTDNATGLTWQQSDSLKGMNWQQALVYANDLQLGGHDDWRLPTAKELQSIVDYSRAPSVTNSPAIDPVFFTTSIKNEAGEKDYPYFWTSTTHLDGRRPEAQAAYIAFGTATGKMRGKVMDVHGAGSQRSDPKTGQAMSRGPQGDMIRVQNFVRCVRGGKVKLALTEMQPKSKQFSTVLVSDTEIAVSQLTAPNQNRFMQREDKNGDGKVSMEEFGGSDAHFLRFDKDGDGFIGVNEAPTGALR